EPIQRCSVAPWTPDDAAVPGGQGAPLTKSDPKGFLDPFFGLKPDPLGQAMKGVQFRDVHDKLTILTGLSNRANAGHLVGYTGFLAQQRIYCDVASECRATINTYAPSVDQQVGRYFADNGYTPIDALVLAGFEDPDKDMTQYAYHMSWKTASL